jgi:hypothetical protein
MIYDTAENQITSALVPLESEAEETLDILIDCEDGFNLSWTVDTVTVEARKVGDSFAALPIDLTPFSALSQPVAFEIKLTAPVIESYRRESARFRVGR